MSQTLFDIYERHAPSLDPGADLEANSEAPSLLGAAFRYSLATNFTAWGMRKAGEMFGDEEKISVEDLNEKFNFKSDRPLTRSQLNFRIRTNELDQKFQEAYAQTDGSFGDKAAALGGGLIGGFLDPAAIIFSLGAGALVSGGLKAVGAARTLGILKTGNLPSKIAARAGIYGSVEAGVNMEIGSKVAESQDREYTVFDRFADAAFGVIFGTLFPIGLDSPKKLKPTPNKDKLIKDMVKKVEVKEETSNLQLKSADSVGAKAVPTTSSKPAFNLDQFIGKEVNTPPLLKVDDSYVSIEYMRSYLKENLEFKKGDEFSIDFYNSIEKNTGLSKKEWLIQNQGLSDEGATSLIHGLEILEDYPAMWNAAVNGSPALMEYLKTSFTMAAEDFYVMENIQTLLADPKLASRSKVFTEDDFVESISNLNKQSYDKMSEFNSKASPTKEKISFPEDEAFVPFTEQQINETISHMKKVKADQDLKSQQVTFENKGKTVADTVTDTTNKLNVKITENSDIDFIADEYFKGISVEQAQKYYKRGFEAFKKDAKELQKKYNLTDGKVDEIANKMYHAARTRGYNDPDELFGTVTTAQKLKDQGIDPYNIQSSQTKFNNKRKSANKKRAKENLDKEGDRIRKEFKESEKAKRPKLTIVKDKK